MATSEIYRGWDVHAYTADMRGTLQRWRQAHPKMSALLDRPVRTSIIEDHLCPFFETRDPSLKAVLDKMKGRSTARAMTGSNGEESPEGRGRTKSDLGLHYPDPDLDNINIWALLAIAVRMTTGSDDDPAEKAPAETLVEMLVDTAQTCIQGDSHRIAMFVLVLSS